MKPAFLFAVALCVSVPAALADPMMQDDLNWLKTMVFAAHQTDYSGIFVYQYDNHIETSHITHIIDRDGEHERLQGLDGARHEIIRNNDQVWRYLGDSKIRVEERQGGWRFPGVLPEQLALLNENYQIKQTEERRIAGYHAHAVIFKPRDDLRYTHRLWAHSDSGLLLKAEVLDEQDRVIEQSIFIQLTIGGNIDRSWTKANKPGPAMPEHKAPLDHLQKTESLTNASGWKVDMLPPGFKKITEIRRHLYGKTMPVIQLVFSDGLASISFFIEGIYDELNDHPGLSSQGAIQVYSKVSGEYLLTVVGEVPPRTVMQVADSIRYSRK